MSKRTKILCCLTIIGIMEFFSPINMYGKELILEHYSVSNGLANSKINDIQQDDLGFIWFGTEDGLNRFDGYNFQTYRHNRKDTNSLNSSFINTIYSSKNGNLWIGTINGLNKYNPECDCFTSILENVNILSITEDIQNNLIVGTVGGIRIIDINKDKILQLSTDDGLPSNLISKTYRDKRNNILCIDPKNLFELNQQNRVIKILHTVQGTEENIIGISEDIQGFLWICTTKNLTKLDPYNDYAVIDQVPFKNTISNIPGWGQFLIDSDNNFWIGDKEELIQFSSSKRQFDEVNLKIKNILIEKSETNLIYEDKFGNIWISQYNNGVFVKIKNKNYFDHYYKVPAYPDGLSSNVVVSFSEDSHGNIWIGTWGGGLNVLNPVTRKIKQFKFKEELLNKGNFRGLDFVSPTTLWAVTSGADVIKLDINTGDYVNYKDSISPGINIYDFFRDSRGNSYIGTSTGVLSYNHTDNTFYNLNSSFQNNDLQPIQYARILEEDKYGNIWVGTHGSGLYRIKNQNNYTRYRYNPESDANQLNNNIIYSLLEDRRGLMWIGTMGGGLNLFIPSSGKFYHLTTDNGLPSNIINGILENEDQLWISTNNGLCKFDIPKFIYSETLEEELFNTYDFSKHFQYFDESNGIQSKEFKYGSYFKSSTGAMYFGGVNGFNTFFPDKINMNTEPPLPLISNFYIHGERQLQTTNDSPLDSAIFLEKEIELKHNQNFFAFDFLAVNYNNTQKNKYRYILEGFESGWTETSEVLTATYMNVNPGEYIFKVIAANNDGVWNEKARSIKITIVPPLWKKLWFQSIIIFSLFSLLFAFYRYRLQMIKQNNFELEKKINERTQQLKESNLLLRSQKDKLGEMANKIHQADQLQLRFFTNISHDFRTPLTLILGPVEKLLSEDLISENLHKQLTLVRRNAQKLLSLVNELLEIRKLDTGKMKVRAQEINITKFVENIAVLYEQYASQKKIELAFLCEEHKILLWLDPNLIEKVFSNILSNAFKYTPENGKITIQVQSNNQKYVEIIIEDTGPGIPKDKIKYLFDRFYQVDGKLDKNTRYGSGIGLALCKDYIDLHQGNINIVNNNSTGLKVIIELKKGKEHFQGDQINGAEFLPADYENEKDYLPVIIPEEDDFENEIQVQDKDLPTILIIEDNNEMLSYIISILKNEYNLQIASTGEEGFKKAVDSIPELIIMDIMLPNIDGLTLCRNIKADTRTSHIPIIILSALAGEEDKNRGFHAGADDYITKPFTENILQYRIKTRITNRRKLINRFKDQIGLNKDLIKGNSPNEAFLKQLIETIENNLPNENFSATLLASEMNFSRTQLYRKISAITDQSPSAFIRSYKMRKAAELLISGNYNISEVAFMVGFKTLPHFTKTFTAIFNETPSAFIKKRR